METSEKFLAHIAAGKWPGSELWWNGEDTFGH